MARSTQTESGQTKFYEYAYGSDASRVSVITNGRRTKFLIDANNFTGYTQTLRETTRDVATGQLLESIDYEFGATRLAQIRIEFTGGVAGAPETLTFTADAHGSTRLLTGHVGEFVEAYAYAAYGELLALTNAANQQVAHANVPINAAGARTSALHSGEQWDSGAAAYYNRARRYDPSSGRFLGPDENFGSETDPQTYHKYGYVFGDPTNHVDPSGWFGIATGSSAIFSVAAGVFGADRVGHHWVPKEVFREMEAAIGAQAHQYFDNFTLDPIAYDHAGHTWGGVSHFEYNNNVRTLLTAYSTTTGQMNEVQYKKFATMIAKGTPVDQAFGKQWKKELAIIAKWRTGFLASVTTARMLRKIAVEAGKALDSRDAYLAARSLMGDLGDRKLTPRALEAIKDYNAYAKLKSKGFMTKALGRLAVISSAYVVINSGTAAFAAGDDWGDSISSASEVTLAQSFNEFVFDYQSTRDIGNYIFQTAADSIAAGLPSTPLGLSGRARRAGVDDATQREIRQIAPGFR